MCEKYPGEYNTSHVKAHLFKILYVGLQQHTDLRDALGKARSIEDMKQVALDMKVRREGVSMDDKLGWYYRHWKSMGLDPASTPTHSLKEWNLQCQDDPLFQAKIKTKQNSKEFKQMDVVGDADGESPLFMMQEEASSQAQ